MLTLARGWARGGFASVGKWRESQESGGLRGEGGSAEGSRAKREMRDSGGVGADTRGCRRYHGYHHPRCEQALHVILA